MPPNSKELWEEGAVIKAFKVVEGGEFKEAELTELLMAPAKSPGCQGTRCLRDNVSDIKAQAAANHRGSQLIHSLIKDYGLEAVQFYSMLPSLMDLFVILNSNSGGNTRRRRTRSARHTTDNLQIHEREALGSC